MILIFILVIAVAGAAVIGTALFIRNNPAKAAAANSSLNAAKVVATGLLSQK